MDERKRMLATAWRDLAGDAVGMVWMMVDDEPDSRRSVTEDGEETDYPNAPDDPSVPDVDAPANWGVWLAWLLGRDLEVDIVPQMPRGCGRFAISVGRGRHYGGPFSRSLLLATIDGDTDNLSTLPPSVTVWWESEKTAHTPTT